MARSKVGLVRGGHASEQLRCKPRVRDAWRPVGFARPLGLLATRLRSSAAVN